MEPSLIIGIGGTGARVLSKPRAAAGTADVSASNQRWQFLALDTDDHLMESQRRGSSTPPLPHTDVMYLPLRRREEFRRESDR